MDSVVLRAARPDEAGALSDLAMRSKAHWGYGASFLEACRAELTFTPAHLSAGRFTVADCSGRLLGFYSIDGQPPDGELGNLWVDPERIGAGLGRRLWQHAMRAAAAAGFARLRVEAEPHAEGFYRAMGARPAGQAPSGSIPGRTLPTLLVRVTPGA